MTFDANVLTMVMNRRHDLNVSRSRRLFLEKSAIVREDIKFFIKICETLPSILRDDAHLIRDAVAKATNMWKSLCLTPKYPTACLTPCYASRFKKLFDQFYNLFPDEAQGELVFGEGNTRLRALERHWKELLLVLSDINNANGLKHIRSILHEIGKTNINGII